MILRFPPPKFGINWEIDAGGQEKGSSVTALLLIKASMKHLAQVFRAVDLANTSHWCQIDMQTQSQADMGH